MTVHDVAQMLPEVSSLRDLCRSMAMAEAIVNPGGERFYSFNPSWSQTEELASMRNGSGDEIDIVFSPAGAYIRGFDHESPFSPYHHDDVPEPWPGVVDSVPAVFQQYIHEPAFTDEDGTPVVTVCLWHEAEAERWQAGEIDFPDGHPDPDGSAWLFDLLVNPTPEAFRAFVEDYYETAIDIEAVRRIYNLLPLDRALITSLHPAASVKDVVHEGTAIVYPIAPDLSPETS
ncbi:hypothetical protein [Streptomyces acidicola]|uniref:hypothetical protein n=1 Tax=Streptomyces acidicola TaxID=2596892 RepID=UPI00344665E0